MQQINTKSRWIRLSIGVILILGVVYLYITRKEEHQRHELIESASAQVVEKSEKSSEPRIVVEKTGDPDVDRTILLILAGGPFPYPVKDGSVFRNYEKHLPEKPEGFYHEYTVPTPGARDRGARRIVTGGTPPSLFYFTPDHYNTFKKLEVTR